MTPFRLFKSNLHQLGLSEFRFAGLSIYDLLSECPKSEIIKYPSRSKIISQSQPCENLYLIIEGQVKLTRLNSKGQELTTDIRYKSDFFGHPIINSTKHISDENVISITTAYLWKANIKDVNNLLKIQPTLSIEIIRLLSSREISLKVKFQFASQESVQLRLAHTLMELSGGFEEKCEHGYGKHIKITQQELADMVGASRPTVSTLLNQLRSNGILNYSRDYLCVQSVEAVLEVLNSTIN